MKISLENSSKDQVQIWVGQMCFKLSKNDQLDIKKAKMFYTYNIFRNLIKLPKQMKQQSWETIDNCMQTELFPYYRFNFPQSEQEKRLSKLSQLLVEKYRYYLAHNSIGDDGFVTLLKGFKNRLKFLCIMNCRIKIRGIQSMVNAPINNLKKLWLNDNFISNRGAKYLAKADLSALQGLYLGGCRIQTEGFKHLSKSVWPNLVQLYLGQNIMQFSNRMQLSGWQAIHNNKWRSIKLLQIPQGESICCLNCVIIETNVAEGRYQMEEIGIQGQIENQQMKRLVLEIIRNGSIE